jgi:predicted Zn-dependent peptidase
VSRWLVGVVPIVVALVATGVPSTAAAEGPRHAQKPAKKKGTKPGGKKPPAPPPATPAPPPAKPVAVEPAPPRALPLTIERLTLDNGLRVVLAPDGRAPVVAVSVAYDVGSRDEERGSTGLVRWLGKGLSSGSANVLRGEHERLVATRAGESWVESGTDRLVATDVAPSGELPLLLWLEADRMKSLQLGVEALEASRRALLSERQTEDGSPSGAGRARLRELVFQASFPLEHDPRGALADIASLRPEAVRALYEARCAASNAVLTLTGDFEVDHAVSLVHRFFDTAKKQERPAPSASSPPAEQTSERVATLDDPRARATTLLFGWALPPLGTDDHEALEAALDILAAGPGARLARLPFPVRVAGSMDRHRGPDLLTLELTLPEDASRAEVAKTALAEIEALAKSGPTDAELGAYRAHREAAIWATLGDPIERARRLGAAELTMGDARAFSSELPRAAAVTRDRVKAAVARWLSPTRRSSVEVGPPRDDAPPVKPPTAVPAPPRPKPRSHK